jgi:TRAP-type C4-dicarboxylate transport system permease small subunit
MLLGSAVVLRKGLHIGVDNFVNKLPPRFRQIVLKVNLVLILIFSVAMIFQGFRLIGIAKNQIIPEMGIPMAIIYYMIPVSGILLVLSCIELLLRPSIDSLTAGE